MKSDVIDILFENRNKAYGAYDLRKHYTERLNKAFIIMLIIAGGFAAFILLARNPAVLDAMTFQIPETVIPSIRDEIKKPEIRQPQVRPQQQTTISAQQKLAKPVIVDDPAKSEKIKNINDNIAIGSTTVIAPHSGPPLVQPPVTGSGGNPVPDPPKIDRTIPVDPNTVDVLPSYPGGMDALRKFLEKHLQNPRDLDEGESVTVKIKFVVGYDGKLQSFVTVQDGGAEFNREVIRVLKKMPEWVPGKAGGEAVAVYYTIPVKFVSAN